MAEKKEKQYVSDNARLMAEWNYEKNNELIPIDILPSSNKKVWWICKQGHEWQAVIGSRKKGHGCPYCAGQKAIPGKTDLKTINPLLSEEWDYEKNEGLTPARIMPNSGQKVWWKCKKGHQWKAVIANRAKGSACPYCSGYYPIIGENDLQTINPRLAKEWNYEKNDGLTPAEIMPNSGQKVWWKCKNGHEWQAVIASRNTGIGCPYCSGRIAIKGKTDLQTINPRLAKEWNYAKNGDLKPEQFTVGSSKKVWWICDKNHEWQAAIANRNKEHGCPYCSGLYVIKGKTDLQTINPKLASEWNYEKNNELTPIDILPSSNKKVWWICKQGHEWQAVIASRNTGIGCPYCAGQKVLKGYNDLSTLNPLLAQEWNYAKNGDLKPEQFTVGSGKKVWWRCQKGHEWQAHINNRNKGIGCPYCSGRCAIVGETDLQTVNSLLAKEWNYEKNTTLTPSQVTFGSGKKVWWKCSKGHEWRATVSNRNKGRGCPICTSERHTSFPEYALLYYLKKYGLEAIHSYKEKGYELDIYIPSKKIAIEYDGYFWHKNKENKDLQKNKKCAKDGIQLYRIREDLPTLNDSSIDYIAQNNRKSLTKILKEILSEVVGFNVEIDLLNDSIAIDNLRNYSEKERSLLFFKPEIEKQWNYEKNGKLRLENFLANSGKKVWWKCEKGHEWQSKIQDRNRGLGCPYCSGRYAVKGETDLQTVNPKLASEWNHEKNNGLMPMDVLPNTAKKIWWKCQNGHEWQATVNSRTRGSGCPYCSGRRAIKGETDLQTVNPVLANEWNYEKNNELTPMNVLPSSNKKVWWICNQGHEWQAIIGNRIKGHGCPYCAGQKVLTGENDLQTVNPLLVNEWDFEKNNGLTPMDVMPYSDKKVWWKCQKGHEWQAVIKSRSKGAGCPYCSGLYAIKGKTDLQTVNRKLASEWHYDKNNGLTPADILPNSNKKVWWICEKGHEWQNTINNRNSGRNCPFCANKKILPGFNDLLTVNPTLAKEWNDEKNNDLTPVQVAPYSNKKVWWKCVEGHEWQTTVCNRSNGYGCPECAKEKRMKNKNKTR